MSELWTRCPNLGHTTLESGLFITLFFPGTFLPPSAWSRDRSRFCRPKRKIYQNISRYFEISVYRNLVNQENLVSQDFVNQNISRYIFWIFGFPKFRKSKYIKIFWKFCPRNFVNQNILRYFEKSVFRNFQNHIYITIFWKIGISKFRKSYLYHDILKNRIFKLSSRYFDDISFSYLELGSNLEILTKN